MLCAPTMAADSMTSLRATFADAARLARAGDDLDPAYELLGIAETAQKQDQPQIAAQAAAAFADLITRAAGKALGGSHSEDTLDQFVDLRFMARSANLPLPQAALDDAMAGLFPLVSASIQKRFDAAGDWAEKLKAAEDLADLQASATQILNEDQSGNIGAAFETRLTQLEVAAGESPNEGARGHMLDELARARKSRGNRMIDAKANNINVVAALLQNQGGATATAGSRAPSEVDVPEELAAGTRSCIETGFTGKQDPILIRTLQVNCINSGRLPVEGRCPTNNLAFLCYDATPGSEKMTYVYRGTPEELYFQRKCGAGKLVKADELPASGAAFRAGNAALGFTCAPSH